MGRGDRAKVRWRNDRIKKKHDRDRRKKRVAGEKRAGGTDASGAGAT